jgi:hypothetical protein
VIRHSACISEQGKRNILIAQLPWLALGMRSVCWSLATVHGVAVAPLRAQTAESIARAAATITPAALARHIDVIADDSMLGRDTPSRGLELTADYVAEQFAAAGLRPVVDGGKLWLQRYRIPPRLDFSRSRLVFAAAGAQATAGFDTAAYLSTPSIPYKPVRVGVLLVAGPQTPASLKQAGGHNKIVLHVPPASADNTNSSLRLEVQSQLIAGNRGLVTLSSRDPVAFAGELQAARRQPIVELGAWRTLVNVRPDAAAGFAEFLTAAGLDLAQLRRATSPVVRDLPGVEIGVELQLARSLSDSVTIPNVLGKLEGSDPRLKNEYVVLAAHMDHLGIRPGRPDSVANGADDNASGVAGLIALAQAFGQAGVRPRRTLLFAAVSGGVKDLWGSHFLAKVIHGWSGGWLEAPRVVAALTLDMLGRANGDTLAVAGLQEVIWPTPPAWIAAAHPELRLTLVDRGTLFRSSSDHFPLVQQARVPSLAFQNGEHDDGAVRDDETSQIDTEQLTRIMRFVFYAGLELANTNGPPRWTAASRGQLLGGLRP